MKSARSGAATATMSQIDESTPRHFRMASISQIHCRPPMCPSGSRRSCAIISIEGVSVKRILDGLNKAGWRQRDRRARSQIHNWLWGAAPHATRAGAPTVVQSGIAGGQSRARRWSQISRLQCVRTGRERQDSRLAPWFSCRYVIVHTASEGESELKYLSEPREQLHQTMSGIHGTGPEKIAAAADGP